MKDNAPHHLNYTTMKDDVRKHLEYLKHEADMCLQRDYIHVGFCRSLLDVVQLLVERDRKEL